MAPRTAKGQNTRPPPRSNPEDCVHAAQQPVYVAQDPCNPSPCGPNAQCRDGICTCVPEYRGDPYLGCRPECVLSTDCPRDKACIRQKCADPCPGTCGQNARCEVVNHIPICSCPPGYSGNAFVDCRIYQEPVLTQPCQPSPCGPNSQCREVNNQAVCSCVAGYVGSPPTCRPECVVNSDCSQNEACSNQKCRNPCPGTCGVGARCEVINHNPICSCPARYTGDPFVRCSPIPDTPPPPPVNPCQPSPCGPYADCRVVGDSPSCSCLPEYKGSPPNCRPEYVSNSECPSHLACINQKCRDPCPGSCGANAECRVVSHTPNCVCLPGYQGDPFSQCYVQQEPIVEEKAMPCNPSPCGANAVCREQNGAGSCTCLPEYIGNPYEGCRPECILNSDCASNKVCISGKCQDPCPGTCGQNADCQVVNHLPSCTCRPGYVGDPFRYCNLAPREEVPVIVDPCNPSPCGPNAQCRKVNEQAVCSCLPNYVRSPPGCRPECVVSSECPLNRACVNQKCVDPCPGTCGQNAICKVVNHVPICACPEGQTGDPFYRCQHIPAPIPVVSEERVNPCYPSPCGPHSQCRNIGGAPSCSCLQGYYGTPPSCRPECTINPECRSNLACIREKCRDPCPGSCGVGAQCSVINHVPICTCQQGYTGDPFISCHVIPQVVETPAADPCFPSPCGSNANCRDGVCTCIPEYLGDPYVGCRPECVINSECPRNKACLRQKCADPCPGTCGQGANCVVSNHVPICSCPPGSSGDSFIICRPFQEPVVTQPCNPSPCGPNSQCRVLNNVTVCSCLPEYVGSPPSCRPECVLNSECNLNQACSNQKCQDPCSGTCGTGARCEVVNHNPICSCPSHTTGNPFVRCYPPAPVEAPPINPCQPSPCGLYAECRVIGDSPSCSCLPEYRGSSQLPP
ncbi:neurogenic locus notch homolog protein 1-like [Ischnura elegans]|uniref:neurogenic locus notch homolog protein 1-like n=1 Tax=Ischnura elegans TaxID=197161 RepID=UPI001ED8963B|nr:neurogenic locus notch homolog protein 1-like [Ischnura elegans]